jgi:hypothetical protein
MISPPRSSYLSVKRRVRLPWPAGDPFHILSIDGGGIKGIFPAAVLTLLEHEFLGGRQIAKCFDLITGTSTGGIIALGLAAGKASSKLLDLYMRDGRDIFPPGPIQRAWSMIRGASMYRYDRAALTNTLERTLGATTLAQSRSRLCIPSFEGHHSEVYIFKTPHHPDFHLDGKERMVTVGQATCAAPTFFRALDSGGYRFVDGGIWANNPIMLGLVDALSCFDLDPCQVKILSLGCGRAPAQVGWIKAIGGLLSWVDVIRAAMDLQSQNALGQARLLVGPENVLRLEPRVDAPIRLDDWRRASAELPAEAERVVRLCDRDVIKIFLNRAAPVPTFP